MKILGIETSCDETAASVVEDGRKILSNMLATSADMHAKTGGIIPEVAAREQLRSIIPVVSQALKEGCSWNPKIKSPPPIEAIAVTTGGPGLIGSMLVGVETAKTLAYVWQKPIIPVVHLLAHVYANWLRKPPLPEFPAIVLTVAGGHSDLILMRDHGKFRWLGGTRDDAAGETFDKVARLLGFSFPGGPSIQKAAETGDAKRVKLPRPLIESDDFDFSFSGLKTAVIKELNAHPKINKNDLAASVQEAIADVLSIKAVRATKRYHAKSLLVAGGVAANKRLRELLNKRSPIPVFMPPVELCTDNATFIASYAFFNFHPRPWQQIIALPDPYKAMWFYGKPKG